MTSNDVIEYIYRNKIVHTIVMNIAHGMENTDNLTDLEQDIYLILLEKPADLLISLYNKEELNYYIANIVYNQLRSTTSPYYINYKKLRNISEPLENHYNE